MPRTVCIAIVMLLAATVGQAALPPGVPYPANLGKYYTAYPAPISFLTYLDSIFKCQGEFALCAYATCVTIPKSNPPVAECGCYSFNGPSLGAGTGVLNKQIKANMLSTCLGSVKCTTLLQNRTEFCRRMNDKTMYPRGLATGQADLNPKICRGGTATNCFAAACCRGPPSSRFLPPGTPQYNATCYCPYFTTDQPFFMSSSKYACGPKNAAEIIPGRTLIYNGA
ncbi:hypothetical protein ABPG75_006649 [Micractinium tetrahymenae]